MTSTIFTHKASSFFFFVFGHLVHVCPIVRLSPNAHKRVPAGSEAEFRQEMQRFEGDVWWVWRHSCTERTEGWQGVNLPNGSPEVGARWWDFDSKTSPGTCEGGRLAARELTFKFGKQDYKEFGNVAVLCRIRTP